MQPKRLLMRDDAPPSGFYVYALADPITHEVFYIGKGKGRRVFHHERDARLHAERGNLRKNGRLVEIMLSGAEPLRICIAEDLDEASAYDLERRLIDKSRATLTNRQRGPLHPLQRAYLVNITTIRQFAPEPPSDHRRDLWHEIGAELLDNQERIERELIRTGVPFP